MPIVKSWMPLSRIEVNKVPERGGVYELGDARKEVVFVGKAEAGQLRKQLASHIMDRKNAVIKAKAKHFRYAASSNVGSEYNALLEAYKKTHGGRLPEANQSDSGREPPPSFE